MKQNNDKTKPTLGKKGLSTGSKLMPSGKLGTFAGVLPPAY